MGAGSANPPLRPGRAGRLPNHGPMTAPTATPALVRLLSEIAAQVPGERVDRLWMFPPRTMGEVETGLVVLSLRSGEAGEVDQREVVTARYEVRSGKGAPAPANEVLSRGWAPVDRVPGMIAGVLRRLGGVEEEPREVVIDGDVESWNRFVAEVSDGMVDPTNGE